MARNTGPRHKAARAPQVAEFLADTRRGASSASLVREVAEEALVERAVSAQENSLVWDNDPFGWDDDWPGDLYRD